MSKIIRQEEVARRKGLSGLLADDDTGHLEWREKQVVRASDLAARAEAERMIEEATAEAKKIRERAKILLEQVEHERATAREQGFTEGYEKGMSQATELIAQTKNIQVRMLEEAESRLVALAFAAVKKVIGKAAVEGVVRDVVREVLERSIGDSLVIRVHPEDRPIIESSAAVKGARQNLGKLMRIEEDVTIGRGGCIVESECGTVDARLEVQLAALEKAFQ